MLEDKGLDKEYLGMGQGKKGKTNQSTGRWKIVYTLKKCQIESEKTMR